MSFLRKMFGEKPAASRPAPLGEPSLHDGHDPDDDDRQGASSRSASRREVVHMVLRETMRRHGIPSDWIECRTLSMVRSDRSTGTYVTLIVRGGQDRLLAYVPAFQTSLQQALERFDPRVGDWLRGLAWQFEGGHESPAAMPDPESWSRAVPGVEVREADSSASDAALQEDLRALFAIRDAAIAQRRDHNADFQPTQPG
ncbi:hypothetical protein ACT80S_00685 [Ramlibacter sp. MAHUQ-53]|uniref:hypothetical protein n=1 Tax=unclassified Ramlibacter TaxID=2617605 RepID=UPI00363BD5BB